MFDVVSTERTAENGSLEAQELGSCQSRVASTTYIFEELDDVYGCMPRSHCPLNTRNT